MPMTVQFEMTIFFQFSEPLSVFYPPVSQDQNHHESRYIRKGGNVSIKCDLKHFGFPKVSSFECYAGIEMNLMDYL